MKIAHAGRAESLIETLVAITVIVLATTAALSLIRVALRGNQVIGDKLIAINLALEGIEAVRNIRDSNYLRFAADAETCWNTLNVTDVDDCGTAETISAGTPYYLTREFSTSPLFKWNLERVVSTSTTDGYLDLYSISADLDHDGTDETLQLYAQTGLSTTGFTTVVSQPFYRTLTMETVDADGDGLDDYFDLTVTVSWLQQSEEKSVSLTRTIANIY